MGKNGYKRKYKKYKRKYKKSKAFGKKLLRDAKTPGTNSLAELAVKIIAKKEALKLLPPNLVFRSYLFATYDRDTNRMGAQAKIGWRGRTTILPRIPVRDNEPYNVLPVNGQHNIQTPVADNSVINKFLVSSYGGHVGFPFRSGRDMFRAGTKIIIKNVQVGIRVTLDPTYEVPQIYEHAFVKWAVVVTQSPGQSAAGAHPIPATVLKMRIFGYSSRLDEGIAQNTTHTKYRTLMKGTLKVNYRNDHVDENQKTYFAKCNVPIEYGINDAVGEQQIGANAMYLVIRSNIPDPNQETHPDEPDYRPGVGAYFKLGYVDV